MRLVSRRDTLAQMKILSFVYVRPRDAVAYLAHIEARGPARLGDLARAMDATSGPLDAMDGSFESLVPLWGWFVAWFNDGLPGVRPNARPSRSIFLNGRQPDPQDRVGYAAEPITHYLFEVLRATGNDPRWELTPFRTRDDGGAQMPSISSSLATRFEAERIGVGIGRDLGGRDRYHEPESLLRAVLQELELAVIPGDPVAGGSLLTSLLQLPPVPLGAPIRIPPIGQMDPRWLLKEAPGGGDLMIADERADASQIETMPPLDAAAFAHGLNAAGWTHEGGMVTPEALWDEATQLTYGDVIALIEPLVEDGELRALNLYSVNSTDAEWASMESALAFLAKGQGARVDGAVSFRG